MPLPDGLLLACYGDDFTGSTDVMEVFARAGLPAVLFLDPPTPEQLARFPGGRAVVVAGHSRTMTPAQMDAELPPVYEALKALRAPIVHSKICSTFDSSPEIGSIGRTIETGRRVFGGATVPVVVGAPALNRWVAFGNLFARSGPESGVFRLDRHPTMSRHPVTPMREADLRRVLAEQTDLKAGLVDAAQLEGGQPDAALALKHHDTDGAQIALFDTLTEAHMETIGRVLWERAEREPPLFSVSSSGLEYALTAYWRAQGWLPEPPTFKVDPVDQIVVVSGSCSPVTARQIDHAVNVNGFAEVALDTPALLRQHARGTDNHQLMRRSMDAFRRAGKQVQRHLGAGRSVVIHTCKGPEDARLIAAKAGPIGETQFNTMVGWALENIARDAIAGGVRRAIVCGGDTSGSVARRLGIEALEIIAPFAPGSPLCRLHFAPVVSDSFPGLRGRVEILFKGGQVGWADLFERVRQGRSET